MQITVIAGGVGGARFLLGLRALLSKMTGTHEITAIVNTGDDAWVAGLRITPDLDSIMYALAGVNDTVRGWGRAEESERVSAELSAWGVGWPWFTLGDLDIGAHIARTAWLKEGISLSQVVERMSKRWNLGVRLLPASDDEVETWVRPADDNSQSIHFQEWWVRHRAGIPVQGFERRGLTGAHPAPGVLEAIGGADLVIFAPSNPVVSIGTVLDIPRVRKAVENTNARVVGVSPVIDGRAVRGMADACLRAIGVPTSADAIATHYGARGVAPAGVLDGWLIDTVDAELVPKINDAGIIAKAVPLWMRDQQSSSALAGEVLALAEQISSPG